MSAALVAAAYGPELLPARLQMAFTLAAHIALACLGVGFPALMLFAEWRFLKTGDQVWQALARRWAKVFAVLFAVGAVSGTVVSFELGLLWPEFMRRFGAAIALPFMLEGFAFFIEAIFLGIYLYGWDRLSPRAHWLAGWPIALSGLASAWFVVTVNAWMNAPQGFLLADGVVVAVAPAAVMFNAATWSQTTHVILSAYMVSGFVVASVYAVVLLRGRATRYHRRALVLALGLGAVLAPAQLLVGDWAVRTVARTQPVKFAAMEAQFRTEPRAPLRIGGLVDAHERRTRYALEIPGALSFMIHGDTDAVVRGLDAVAPEDTPPVAVVHFAFQIMVGSGMALLALALWAGWSALRRRRLPRSRWFLWAVVASGPLAMLAMETGWVVTEVGRQPWVVQGVMRTREAVTDAPGIWWSLGVVLAVYAALAAGLVLVLGRLARHPLPEVCGES